MKYDIQKDIVSQSSYFKSRPDPVTLGELEEDLKSWKTLRVEGQITWKNQKKLGIFNLKTGDQILMRPDIQKYLVSKNSYSKSRLYLLRLWGGGRENWKYWETLKSGEIGIKLGEKNKHKYQIRD